MSAEVQAAGSPRAPRRPAGGRGGRPGRAERRRRTLLGGVVAGVVVLVALVAVVVVQTHRTSTVGRRRRCRRTRVDGSVFAVGSADAPVTRRPVRGLPVPQLQGAGGLDGSTHRRARRRRHRAGALPRHGVPRHDANDQYSTRALNAAAVVVDTAGPDAYQTFHDLLFANQPAEGGWGSPTTS